MEQQTINPTEFFDGNDRVLALMDLRRNAKTTLQQSDEIKAALCNKIQQLQRDGVGLRSRLVAISDVDPELSAYITALESINGGIWCQKCKDIKVFGGVTSSAVAAPAMESQRSRSAEDSLEITRLHAHFASAKEELTMLTSSYEATKTRIEILTMKLSSYENRLNNIDKRAPTVTAQSVPPPSASPHAPTVTAQSIPPPVNVPTHVLSGLTKDDLPPAPDFDINITIDESASADDLLN